MKKKNSLTDQIRRASVSITSNIAEGFGRQTYKDKIKFYYQANGSIFEVKNQLIIARDLGYIKLDAELLILRNSAHKLLHGLISASKKRI
ncbi:four helix bundle protein [Candidatus Berkelbacteria bacterium CG11_big_fil_rev_8_21_14_0_20_40_23]|nr:four helix bundle protein [bacterium]PIR28184.1 MAG: four helix bundle protein [Candidatus Berkelbacteria bacterium CG11_big_fil_rev_8_21_14_0_20_40_23]